MPPTIRNSVTTPTLNKFRFLKAEQAAASLAYLEAAKVLAETKADFRSLEFVEKFYNVLADDRRAKLENRVESLVDEGLKYVFGSQYSFKIKSELTGKQIRTKFYIQENGLELNILDAAGGGIADTVAFLLRIVMLVLKKPAQRRVLILDESLKFLSTEYLTRMAEFIPELAKSLDLQIIMTTHRQELVDAATTVIRVTKVGKESRAEIS